MNVFWIFILVVCLAQLITCNTKPHIIFMVADDYGWNDVGFRNPDIKTPNIDDAANNGIILNSSYVQPVCTPSRAALMTGYYPFRTGTQTGVILFYAQYGLPLQFKLLPEALKDLGYSTHIVGKWHLGSCNSKYLPTNRGFDTFFGFLGPAVHYYSHSYPLTNDMKAISKPGTPEVHDFWNKTEPALNYNGTYSSASSVIPFVAQVKAILSNKDPENPLFLYLSYQTPHTPTEHSQTFSNLYEHLTNPYRRQFSALVTEMDDNVGQVIKLLKDYKFYDNSIIIFTADNGGDTRAGGNNYPLKGAKGSLYEGGTRASAFVHSPLLKNKGYTYNGLIHIVDWYPTLIALAGGKPDDDIDGVNVWPSIINNAPSPRKEFIYDLNAATAAIRVGKWKLIVGDAGLPITQIKPENVTGELFDAVGGAPSSDLNSPFIKLYNVNDDPYEKMNLASRGTHIVDALLKKINRYKKKMVLPLFKANNVTLYKQMTANLTVLNTDWCVATETVTIIP